ncbi:MAG: hypothetical protein HY360_19035, partial [Verrucomicrobia bacterium]|nr:hypothetical protein [Verrucomicrobiota bacterium]
MNDASFTLIPQHFGSLVYDHAGCRYAAFDQAATTLLTSSIHTPIEQAVSTIFSGDKCRAALLFAQAYREQGYFNADGIFLGRDYSAGNLRRSHHGCIIKL